VTGWYQFAIFYVLLYVNSSNYFSKLFQSIKILFIIFVLQNNDYIYRARIAHVHRRHVSKELRGHLYVHVAVIS